MTSRTTDPAQVAADVDLVRLVLGLRADAAVELDDQGWDSRVYLVDGGVRVCKIARDEVAAAQYRAEIGVLRLLESVAVDSVALPRVLWVDPSGCAFAYAGIVGTPMSACITALDESRRRSIGAALGRFAARLHALHLDGVTEHTIADDLATYRHKLALAAPALAAALTDVERSRVERFVADELVPVLRRDSVNLVLAHGDLGPWNVVVAPTGVGVIDFGDVGRHDPAKDFSGFGDDVITDAALDAYGADRALRARAAVRARALPLLDIPFFVGKRDVDGVGRCIARLRATLLASGG